MRRRKIRKSALVVVLTLVLVIGCSVGATLAWLTASSGPVTNTFTTSNIEITLTETTGAEYKMVPGYTIRKDPKVTVTAGSEVCYLFVKLEESDNFDYYLSYEMADGWTALTGVSGVYYREVQTSDMGTEISVLKDDQVLVLNFVTKDMMNSLTANTYPTLTVTAYASQLYKDNSQTFTANEAWAKVYPSSAD